MKKIWMIWFNHAEKKNNPLCQTVKKNNCIFSQIREKFVNFWRWGYSGIYIFLDQWFCPCPVLIVKMSLTNVRLQIEYQGIANRFEYELRQEMEEKKRLEDEKSRRKIAFKEKTAIFQWCGHHTVKNPLWPSSSTSPSPNHPIFDFLFIVFAYLGDKMSTIIPLVCIVFVDVYLSGLLKEKKNVITILE